MSIDPKLFELTADVLEIFLQEKKNVVEKMNEGTRGWSTASVPLWPLRLVPQTVCLNQPQYVSPAANLSLT